MPASSHVHFYIYSNMAACLISSIQMHMKLQCDFVYFLDTGDALMLSRYTAGGYNLMVNDDLALCTGMKWSWLPCVQVNDTQDCKFERIL